MLHEREQYRDPWLTRRVENPYFNHDFVGLMKNHTCSRPLQDGDIVNIDVTVYKDGFHGDTSQTFLVGDVVRIISSGALVDAPDTSRPRTRKVENLFKLLEMLWMPVSLHAHLVAHLRASVKPSSS